jgi:hypothetical protein
MRAQAWLGLAALLLGLPATVEASGFRRHASVTYSYYPSTVWYVPVLVVNPPMCVAAPAVPPRVYATPTPAPPLGAAPAGPQPGNPPMPPAVKENRSFYDAYAVAGKDDRPVNGSRCTVGFWNNTGQDLVLRIDGQSRPLPNGRGVSLELPRVFVWQVVGREPQSERVPAEQTGVEIVIRR